MGRIIRILIVFLALAAILLGVGTGVALYTVRRGALTTRAG
jgi:hypothetical protein